MEHAVAIYMTMIKTKDAAGKFPNFLWECSLDRRAYSRKEVIFPD